MFIFYFLMGVCVIALGILAIKRPDSWLFKRIGDDREPIDTWLSYVKFAGVISIIMGVIIIILGMQHLF
ncbi:hypothetical protein J45TS6_17490 [Paenibacillus sp. J45TS6]|nr:hypothetical protein J45TS6_17490 [Paenibacillus sp. J45TS6]